LCFLVLLCALPSFACAVSGARASAAADRSRLLAMAVFVGSLGVSMAWVMTALNRGAATWAEARALSPWQGLATLIVPAALALAAHRALRRRWPDRGKSGVRSQLTLAPGERVYWSDTAKNPWILGIGLLFALSVLGVPLPFFSGSDPDSNRWVQGLIHALAAVACEAAARVTVQVDSRGLTVSYGYLGWLRQRIALARIASAHAVTIRPLAHGGWGYRGVPLLLRRATVVVRGGPGLRLELVNGRRFSVTVDHPESGAALINGLLQREQSAPLSSSEAAGASAGPA
jgi:hypothetical protein